MNRPVRDRTGNPAEEADVRHPERTTPRGPSPILTVLLLAALAAPAAGATVIQLERSGAATSPETIDYRWSDLDQNPYAAGYVASYTYDDATVTVGFETGEPTFTGHLSAAGLKPNFAYQVKLVGKPTGLWGAEGDDVTNERLGYAGRWWEVSPGVGNRTDAYYETYRDDPAYVFEAYLLFDFFLTDGNGDAELDFALDSSYHVLFWDWQGTQGACDRPLKSTTVVGAAAHPAYDADVGPEDVGVYPQIERLCNGQTALPLGAYRCRLLLTEESFHTADGNWAPAMVHDDVAFDIGEGLFPPALSPEPAYTAGTQNTIAWTAVGGATRYRAECSLTSDFATVLQASGWITTLAHTFPGLADGQIHHFRVRAGDDGGEESAWSATAASTQDDGAPASAVGTLPAAFTGTTLAIPFTAADATSGVDHVELHYGVDGAPAIPYVGSFTASPIAFQIPGDGAYAFHTVAVDRAGNREAAPAAPDAVCVITATEPPAPVGNPDYVDIGTLASEGQTVMGEPPHNMVGWGPTAPGAIGGNYGGIAPGSCRPVWSPTEFDLPHEPWADIDLDFGPPGGAKTLWVRYLDGASTDDQRYLIDGVEIGSIETGDPGENWYWHDFDVSAYAGTHTLRIEATEPEGTYWDPYGQVAIDILSVCGAAALFAAEPADPAPLACGDVRSVAVRFTQGCEAIRGYAVRVRCADGLTFDGGDVVVLDPTGTGDVVTSVTRNADDDWTIAYAVGEASVPPGGIPSGSELFRLDVHAAADGAGRVILEEVSVEPILLVPPPVLERADATLTVDCTPPAGGLAVNEGAATTNDLDVALHSDVADATPLQMRFVNAPDDWAGPEDGWEDYAPVRYWTLAAGADGPRTVRAEYRDAVGLVLAVEDGIAYASEGPGAASGLTAAPGHRRIGVAWQDPAGGDLAFLEVWRAVWADDDQGGASAYPEYGGLPNDVLPARPVSRADALASPRWTLAGSVPPGEQSFDDVDGPGGLPRGIYLYEVFAADTAGLYGPRADAGAAATSYLLGDRDGDGAVTLAQDVNQGLALCYGTVAGGPSFDNECDYGPTDDHRGDGIPQPDDAVDFKDLMILALNFDTVLDKGDAPPPAAFRFAWTETAPGAWTLSVTEAGAELKGLRLTADLGGGAVRTLAAGDLLLSQGHPFFLADAAGPGLDVGLALLGDGARLRGTGELLHLTVAAGSPPDDPHVDARDAWNSAQLVTLAIAAAEPPPPLRHRAGPAVPNPFNPSTRIAFELPVAEEVTLAIYSLDGRRVVTLAAGVWPAGRHEVVWDGRDGRGDAVASGTYVSRLQAGSFTRTCKMTLLK